MYSAPVTTSTNSLLTAALNPQSMLIMNNKAFDGFSRHRWGKWNKLTNMRGNIKGVWQRATEGQTSFVSFLVEVIWRIMHCVVFSCISTRTEFILQRIGDTEIAGLKQTWTILTHHNGSADFRLTQSLHHSYFLRYFFWAESPILLALNTSSPVSASQWHQHMEWLCKWLSDTEMGQ